MAIAIFAGITLFSIIFLYTKTADRWNWKKIVIWAGGISLVPVVGFFLLAYSDQLFKDFPLNHKGLLTSFNGVAIGSDYADVEFKYGKLKRMPDEKEDTTYFYEHPVGFGFYVNKSDNKIAGILIDCNSSIKDEFNGIACGDPSEKLQKKFGNNLNIKCEPKPKNEKDMIGDISRSYSVDKFGTRYVLAKNQVILIAIKPNPSKSEFYVDCK